MSMTLKDATEHLRAAMRETVRRHALWYIVQGVLMVVLGILALAYPLITSYAVIILLGWLLIIAGVAHGLSMIGARHVPHFWLQLISIILAVIVGVLFLLEPGEGLLGVTLLLIVFFMVQGMARVVMAFTIRPMRHWVWILLSGVVGIVLSLVLLASMPITALWLLGLLIAIQLMSEGAALAWLAWRLRRDAGAAGEGG